MTVKCLVPKNNTMFTCCWFSGSRSLNHEDFPAEALEVVGDEEMKAASDLEKRKKEMLEEGHKLMLKLIPQIPDKTS